MASNTQRVSCDTLEEMCSAVTCGWRTSTWWRSLYGIHLVPVRHAISCIFSGSLTSLVSVCTMNDEIEFIEPCMLFDGLAVTCPTYVSSIADNVHMCGRGQ